MLRPGKDPYELRELFRRDQTIYLGAEDPPYGLEVGNSAFTLKFYGEKYADFIGLDETDNADVESMKELMRYRVEGDAVIAETK